MNEIQTTLTQSFHDRFIQFWLCVSFAGIAKPSSAVTFPYLQSDRILNVRDNTGDSENVMSTEIARVAWNLLEIKVCLIAYIKPNLKYRYTTIYNIDRCNNNVDCKEIYLAGWSVFWMTRFSEWQSVRFFTKLYHPP